MTASEAEKRHASLIESMRIQHHDLEERLQMETEAHDEVTRAVPFVALAAFLVGLGLGVLGALAVWG